MQWLFFAGILLAGLGLFGIIYVLVGLIQARRRTQKDDELRACLKRMLSLNLASVAVGIIGLCLMVVAVLLQ